MESSIEKLEGVVTETRERLARIETRLEQTATKADMHELQSTMVKWILGAVSGLGVLGITVMTFVLNNAVPTASPAQQIPIIIAIPATAAPMAPPGLVPFNRKQAPLPKN